MKLKTILFSVAFALSMSMSAQAKMLAVQEAADTTAGVVYCYNFRGEQFCFSF